MSIESFKGEYRWLSNFEPAAVLLDGLSYQTTEAAYQAAKTHDQEERTQIRLAATPGAAKRLGQKVKIRTDWDDVKIGIMHYLVREKFKHPHLREKLILTGRQHLVEGNDWGDRFWGVCTGEGENHLGRILMDVRAEILAKPMARHPH